MSIDTTPSGTSGPPPGASRPGPGSDVDGASAARRSLHPRTEEIRGRIEDGTYDTPEVTIVVARRILASGDLDIP